MQMSETYKIFQNERRIWAAGITMKRPIEWIRRTKFIADKLKHITNIKTTTDSESFR